MHCYDNLAVGVHVASKENVHSPGDERRPNVRVVQELADDAGIDGHNTQLAPDIHVGDNITRQCSDGVASVPSPGNNFRAHVVAKLADDTQVGARRSDVKRNITAVLSE